MLALKEFPRAPVVFFLITKDPADQMGPKSTSGGGSRGSFKQYVEVGFQEDERLRLRISREYEAGDGYRKGGSFLLSFDDNYKAGRVALHAMFDKAPNDRFTLSARTALVDGHVEGAAYATFSIRTTTKVEHSS